MMRQHFQTRRARFFSQPIFRCGACFATWIGTCFVNVMASEHATSYQETPVSESDRAHWSFVPLSPVVVPSMSDASVSRNEIDSLVSAVLQQNGLRLQPAATKRILIRRLSYDLTGLPPTREEIAAFLGDSHADAYDRLVDRLLQSPRYGERWAQHWLDLARFAETDGFEHDRVRPDAWKYRDWVIDAFNDDLPYDEFIRLQIAGDELAPESELAVTATRFCLSGPDMPDINLLEERRHTVLNELTATVGEVILGLQLGCAQCHDHKYDPISQADFYRLRAIFEPSLQLEKNKSLSGLQEQVPFERASYVMLRGDFREPGAAVQPDVIRVLKPAGDPFRPQPRETTRGLRTALADWLVRPDHPLTARVIVNRVWQHHFGSALVTTPSDFGVMGDEPRHRVLLDWLAQYLMDHQWSLKTLHRKIVTSATYQQRSYLPTDAPESERMDWHTALRVDPQASMLSRYPRWRLEGEAIRDAMLLVSGRLNLSAGGRSVLPPLPQELVGTLLKNQWDVTPEISEHSRRSIYVFARRNLRYPIFEVFDRPSANVSCPQRNQSTTAPQSLHLLNSQFSLETAEHLAQWIVGEHTDRKLQITIAFERILGRTPSEAEYEEIGRFWNSQLGVSESPQEPLVHLCLSLINCNEFIVID